MTYLSRLMLDSYHPMVRRDLANCHQLHRTILRAFPHVADATNARAHLGVLYRLESLPSEPRVLRLLVQSHGQPDWSFLPRQVFSEDPDGRGNPSCRPLDSDYQRIVVGAQLLFRLRANPTKRISNRQPDRTDQLLGKRVAILREADQLAWLQRKGEQHGFRLLATTTTADVPEARAATQETVRGWRPATHTTPVMPLTFGAVRFDGRLEVTDPALFLQALQQGIGSGKAFGFGLLSIASIG
ncbi:MAG: type I-E CRISPR-associated protein Cas6/Cse3/CasE [Roseiflexaceae bacterium]